MENKYSEIFQTIHEQIGLMNLSFFNNLSLTYASYKLVPNGHVNITPGYQKMSSDFLLSETCNSPMKINIFWNKCNIEENIQENLVHTILKKYPQYEYISELTKIFSSKVILNVLIKKNEIDNILLFIEKEPNDIVFYDKQRIWKNATSLLETFDYINTKLNQSETIALLKKCYLRNKELFKKTELYALSKWLEKNFENDDPFFSNLLKKTKKESENMGLVESSENTSFLLKINKLKLHHKLADELTFNYEISMKTCQRMLEEFENFLSLSKIKKELGIESIGVFNKKVAHSYYLISVESSKQNPITPDSFKALLDSYVENYSKLPKSGYSPTRESLKSLLLNVKLTTDLNKENTIKIKRTKI